MQVFIFFTHRSEIHLSYYYISVSDLFFFLCGWNLYVCLSYWMSKTSLGMNTVSIYLSIYLSMQVAEQHVTTALKCAHRGTA